MQRKIPNPLFVVGVPRSGTTLLGNLLNRHPVIHVAPTTFGPHFGGFHDFVLGRHGLAGEAEQYTAEDWSVYFAQHEPALKRLCEDVMDESAQGLRHLLARGVDNAAEKEGALIWADKSPYSLTEMPELLYLFPEARFIHIIRDGRAVALSQRERQDEQLDYAIHNWKRSLMLGRVDGGIVGPKQYIEVTFEDLLAKPRETLTKLTHFLELEFEDVMMLEASKEAAGGEQGERYVLPYFDKSKTAAWRDKLTKDEIAGMERIAGDMLQSLGYELLYYPATGPFEALPPWRVVSRRQRKLFRRLLKSKVTRKSRESIIEENVPLRKRIVDFFRRSANNYLNPRLVEQFRKDRKMVE